MADAKTEAPPPPPPPPPKPKVPLAEQARQEVAKGKVGLTPTRPLKYIASFIGGTINDTLNGMSQWGRFGFKWGLVSGLAVAIGFPALQLVASGPIMAGLSSAIVPALTLLGPVGMVAACLGGAVLAGAALGGLHGLLTGGTREAGREIRRDRYAEDLVQRSTIRKAEPARDRKAERRQQAREESVRNSIAANYALEYERREQQNDATYWRDRENSRSLGSMGR